MTSGGWRCLRRVRGKYTERYATLLDIETAPFSLWTEGKGKCSLLYIRGMMLPIE